MNIEKDVKYRWWLLTWNNPPEDWKQALITTKADYAIGQLEKGENGTVHIQATVWFKDPRRPAYWKGFPVWCKGLSSDNAAERCQNYCQKDDTRLDGPYTYGNEPFKRNSRTDWEKVRTLAKEGRLEAIEPQIYVCHYKSLKNIWSDSGTPVETTDPRGLWIYGQPGTGKSHMVRTGANSLYIKGQNKWFDGYFGQESILLDDFDKGGECLGHHIKIWADKWKAYGEIKGSMVALKHTKFIVTSNYLPQDIWADSTMLEAIQRRFQFCHKVDKNTETYGKGYGDVPFQTSLYNWINLHE